MKCWNQLSVICSGNVSIRKQFTFNGTRYSVTGKTESEVERKIQSKKQALERENEPTVSQWVDTFLDFYKVNVSDKTRYDYSLVLNHVRSDSKLSDIKPIDLQKMFNLHKDKSKSFIHKLKILTHELFETARSNGYIKNNPMDAVNVPKGYTNHRRALTEEERRNVMELCKTDKRRNFILLMLQCGLRPSETTYIQGKDINKSDRLLHVRGTKTEAADRFIPIPEPLLSMIKDYSGDRYESFNFMTFTMLSFVSFMPKPPIQSVLSRYFYTANLIVLSLLFLPHGPYFRGLRQSASRVWAEHPILSCVRSYSLF